MKKHGGIREGAGRPKGQGKFGEETKPVRLPVSLIHSVLKFVEHKGYQLPLYGTKVAAGFPSPADDYLEKSLDLNEYLIHHPAATFMVRVSGESMVDAGINDGDLLVVDRSIEPKTGKVVIAAINGELTVKRLKLTSSGKILLIPANPKFPTLEVNPEAEICIWGVVAHVIHSL